MVQLIKTKETREMEKCDITKSDLYIKNFLTVVKNHNTKHHKLIRVNKRHSDAFVFVISGMCAYRFDDGVEFSVKEGDVFFLPKGSNYTMYISTDDYRFIFSDFEFDTLNTKGMLFPAESLKNTDILFSRLLNLYRSTSKSKISECMSVLYSIYGALKQASEHAYIEKNRKNMLSDAKRAMDDGFAKVDFEITILARDMNISDVYFRKLFKNQYGTSPLKYLNSLRLQNAMALMKHPFLTLEECATQSGFSSIQYFSRVFKKELGITPGQFRKNN